MIGLFDLVLRHARLVFGLAIILAVETGVALLLGPRVYTSSASFLPQSSSNAPSALSGVASELGITVSGDQSGQSPDFYVALLHQQSMLRRLVDSRYSIRGRLQPLTLTDILAAPSGSPALRRRSAINSLRNQTRIALNIKIGLVQIAVSSRDPQLSKQIADNYLRFVNDANREILRQRATEEGRFIDDRLAATRAELYAAEDRLQSFLRTNREFGNVGELVFQRDRLQRDVQLRQQIYSSLAQAYEQSRLDQVRDTPVITLVEQPTVPEFPDSRHLGVKVILAALVGGLIGILIAWSFEFTESNERGVGSRGEFRRLLARLSRMTSSRRTDGVTRGKRS